MADKDQGGKDPSEGRKEKEKASQKDFMDDDLSPVKRRRSRRLRISSTTSSSDSDQGSPPPKRASTQQSDTSNDAQTVANSSRQSIVVVNTSFEDPGQDQDQDLDDTDKNTSSKFQPKNVELWKHFEIVHEYHDAERTRDVKCLMMTQLGKCNRLLKQKTGSTSSMLNHLRTKHAKDYAKYLDALRLGRLDDVRILK